jgi:hypothetical protein
MMIRSKKIHANRAYLRLAAIFAVMLWAVAAEAADPVFPIGSKLGLVPPAGMAPSKTFDGFVDPEKDAAILLVTFPPVAFDKLDKSMVPDELKKQGIDVADRQPITLGFGKGFIVKAIQNTNAGRFRKWLLVAAGSDLTALVTVQVPDGDAKYSDKILGDTLATLTVRASVPDAERISLVPFAIGDLAGFRIDDVLAGHALMLTDTDPVLSHRAHFLIAAMQGGPVEDKDRGDFARQTFSQINGLKDVRIQDIELLHIGGQAAYETLANAKDPPSNDDLKVVQWLIFGNGTYIQMIGVTHADNWADVFPRFRTVRDSISPK